MAGKFQWKHFSKIDLNDTFFESLKNDYPGNANSTGFSEWFKNKSGDGSTALVFEDHDGLGAFVYLKEEDEVIKLKGASALAAVPRIKIGTLRLAERYRGQRLGEGAIGIALWKWQESKKEEIYVTIFEKHNTLITLIERFGFQRVGINPNGELVYLKSRNNIDYSDPYKSFPFINPKFQKAGYLIVNDFYHDTLFPYSTLSKTIQENIGSAVANGLCKIYVGSSSSLPHYQQGEPLLIYRRHTQNDGQRPRYKSCISSFCLVNDVIRIKSNNQYQITFDELKARIGNKSVFNEPEIREKYDNQKNLFIIEMLYCGYFGAGNNVNMDWLDNNGHWAGKNEYPTDVRLTPEQFKAILKEGNIDAENIIID